MIVFNAWIIICCAYYPVWLVHTFSSYVHCWNPKQSRCQQGCCIKKFSLIKNIYLLFTLSLVFLCPLSGNAADYLYPILQRRQSGLKSGGSWIRVKKS